MVEKSQREKKQELVDSREVLFLVWLRETGRTRKALSGVLEDAFNHLPYVPLNSTGTRIDLKFAQFLSQRIDEEFSKMLGQIDIDIHTGVQNSIRRAIRTQVKFLKENGIQIPEQSILSSIENSVLKLIDKEFPPGSGITYRQRLNSIYAQHVKQVKSILTRSYDPESIRESIAINLRKGIVGPRAGQSSIIGGSASAKLSRLKVAEEARLSNLAEARVIRASGLELAYWRRRGEHRCGTGICAILASETGPGVLDALLSANIPPGTVDLSGLYLLDFWPDYPHPYCQCYPEPFFLPNK